MKKNRYKSIFSVGAVLTGLLLFTQFREEKKPCRASISPERAQAIAFNDLKTTPDGVELSHRNHFVQFGTEGVLFRPKKGPEWKWQLEHFGTQEESLKDISIQSVKPENKTPQIVEYRYGNVVEEYHAKRNTVEQRFVLEKPLSLEGQDLVIRGSVECDGEFEQLKEGWAWKDSQGQVALGDVTVFDAQGKTLLASMNVNANQTEIVVDAKSLAEATYPVTVDPEIGGNDVRISNMGPDGDTKFAALSSAIAYNSVNNEYLVAWVGNDGTLPLGKTEVFIQRIDASNGQEIGINDFQISNTGPSADASFGVSTFISVAVAHNSQNNEYLVVWEADDDTAPINGASEIFGQRLDATTGQEVGANDFRISDMGPAGNPNFDAMRPEVVYNSQDNEYFVVWHGDDEDSAINPQLVDNEFEIFGQRIDASTGLEVGFNDFRISDMGPDGSTDFIALHPAITYNSEDNEYLVVWEGDDNTGTLVDGECEIFGQRIDASTGLEVGNNDFRISDMGPDGDNLSTFNASYPAVGYNSRDNEYLVVWTGSEDAINLGFSLLGEFEIYGQLIDAPTGAEIGTNDFRISNIGTNGDPTIGVSGFQSAVVYDSIRNEYFVYWQGGKGAPIFSFEIGELEIFGQRIDSDGTELGENDIRLSDMGPDGDFNFSSFTGPAAAFSPTSNEYFVVWDGDDNTGTLVDGEFEIFSQRFEVDTLLSDIDKLSLMDGGVQNLTLDFGPNFAGQHYLVLGSLIGTSPGISLGGPNIPLNVGAYFLSTLDNPNSGTLPNGFGVLDDKGQATVQFVLPPGLNLPSGTVVNHAAVVIDAQMNLTKISAVSNAEPCTLE